MTKRLEQLWNWRGDHPFGQLLAVGRHSRNVSQMELAASLGVSNANISRIERGADLRVSTLVELARALRLEPMLVPKEHVTAVRTLLDALSAEGDAGEMQTPRFA